MRVNWGVSGSTGQVFAISVGDVLTGLGVTEALGQTEIDDIHVVLFFSNSNQEIVGLNVSMEEMPGVDEFDSLKLLKIVRKGWFFTYHLIYEHQDGF